MIEPWSLTPFQVAIWVFLVIVVVFPEQYLKDEWDSEIITLPFFLLLVVTFLNASNEIIVTTTQIVIIMLPLAALEFHYKIIKKYTNNGD